jgi:hypothetical protein
MFGGQIAAIRSFPTIDHRRLQAPDARANYGVAQAQRQECDRKYRISHHQTVSNCPSSSESPLGFLVFAPRPAAVTRCDAS